MSAIENVTIDFTTAAGANRYDTAAKVAVATFSGDAPLANLIIARGDAFPDALAGNALAGAAESPILLTRPSSLPAETAAAIEALADEDTVFHFLGGEDAISDDVIDAVEALVAPPGDVEEDAFVFWRIAGQNRYDTAINIAEFMDEYLTIGTTVTGSKTAFITTADNFADAVAVGPLAYHGKFPVLLVPTAPVANDPRVDAVVATINDLEIDSLIILGGTAAVPQSIQDLLAAELGPDKIDRWGGANRYETATIIADYADQVLQFNLQNILLARGDDFADALAAGPHGGEIKAPIILAMPDSLPSASQSWLRKNDNVIRLIRRIGGDAAISRAVLDAARDAATTQAPYLLGDRTDAPELQFVRLLTGESDVLEYVFDKPVSGSSLFSNLGPDGEFLDLRAYSNSCQGATPLWINAAGTIIPSPVDPDTLVVPNTSLWEPLLDEDGVQQLAAGDSQVWFARDASIIGNGNVIRARFDVPVETFSRATVRFNAVADEVGRRSIEAGYPIFPTVCETLAFGPDIGLPRLVTTRNWAEAPQLVNIQRISVDFLFRNQSPFAERNIANDYPDWLIGDVVTNDGDPFTQSFVGSEPHASQFYLVGNNSTIYQGATISVEGTGQVADGYQVRVYFNFNQAVVNEGALRRGYVRDTDGTGLLDAEATDLVQSARYIQSSGITQDPDLTFVVGPILTFPGFTAIEYHFDEAISSQSFELIEDYFRVYDVDYNVSFAPEEVLWKANAASRVAVAYYLNEDLVVAGLGTLAGGFVEDITRDDGVPSFGFGAVRGTDTPQNLNQGWNRAAEASLTLLFGPGTDADVFVIPAGYTAYPDLYQVVRTRDVVTQNWRLTFIFDPFGGNICAVDAGVFFDIVDPNGTRAEYLVNPSDLDNVYGPDRALCVGNTVSFDGGPDGDYLTNDEIETAILGGVEGTFFGDDGDWVTEGSAIVNGPVRFPAGAQVVPGA